MLNVEIVCRDVGGGGAARATRRLVESFWKQPSSDVVVSLRTALGKTEHESHRSGLPGGVSRGLHLATRSLSLARSALPSRTSNEILHSRADIWTGLGRELNRNPPDVVNLHWLGNGTMSIEEIGRLQTSVVMTLHDMWLLNGAAHYAADERYRNAYTRESRPVGDTGIDWDRKVWLRKQRSLQRPFHIVTPSRWLAECAKESPLTHCWPTRVIPNPVDTNFWAPVDRRAARAILDLPPEAVLILFGAVGGKSQPIKGADLLHEALQKLPRYLSEDAARDARLIVFGGKPDKSGGGTKLPFIEHSLGRITDDRILRAAYASADVMVVPSRQDNLPQTATEASACGTPVVAFDVGGLPDIVSDRITGRLVSPFNTDALAEAIAWVIDDNERQGELGRAAREMTVRRFSENVVLDQYVEAFRAAAEEKQRIGRS